MLFELFKKKWNDDSERSIPEEDCRIFIRGQLIPYLEKTWVLDESVKLWFQASNPLAAMTNNSLER